MGVLIGICAICCSAVASWWFSSPAVGVGVYALSYFIGIAAICVAALASAGVYLSRALGHRKKPASVLA